jgi:hypothetical protein
MRGLLFRRHVARDALLARVLLALALAAALLRAVVPVGYMPTAHGGHFEVTICGSDATLALDLGEDGAAAPGHEPCVFSVATLTTAPPAPVALAAPLAVLLAAAPAPAWALIPGRGLAAPPPPSHAPPTSV